MSAWDFENWLSRYELYIKIQHVILVRLCNHSIGLSVSIFSSIIGILAPARSLIRSRRGMYLGILRFAGVPSIYLALLQRLCRQRSRNCSSC